MVRVPLSQITTDVGLQELRLFQLKKHVPELELIAILSLQLETLKDFLNVKANFTDNQILDTAELILQEYDDLSFTAIMDCLKLIKLGRPPFHKELYAAIDGRQVFAFLDKYRVYISELLESRHRDQVNDYNIDISQALAQHGQDTGQLSNLLKELRIDRDKNRLKKSENDGKE